ncbi:MAG: hypothetical protein V9G98_10820 [Candidatus Competibacter sp.]
MNNGQPSQVVATGVFPVDRAVSSSVPVPAPVSSDSSAVASLPFGINPSTNPETTSRSSISPGFAGSATIRPGCAVCGCVVPAAPPMAAFPAAPPQDAASAA